ncbi:MAG: diacylglycerol kinase family lipid kinase [Clostridia bacterium]|nr:diacylglycerol kinase family lipid kinase [Clostridia bacterium]
MKKMYFIVNPCSGKMKIKPALLDVVKFFNEAGYEVTVQTTLRQGHAIELAQNLPDNISIVAVSGGDGTLNEVLTGLLKADKKLPVGYIPAGSTNDFGATVGIPSEPKAAAKLIVNGSGFDIDVGCFDGRRYFSYIASFGIFTAASYKTPQAIKNSFGHLAYVLEGIKDITNITPYNVYVETDTDVYSGKYIFGSVTNTTSVGGIVKFDSELVKMNDGLFEIVLVKYPENINDLSKIVAGCSTSNFSDSVFEFIKAKKVKMTFESDMDWSIDGEHEKSGPVVTIENIKTAATIIR